MLGSRLEASVDREAARWAIPMCALLVAARGKPVLVEAADILKTTEALLRVRLQGLHLSQRGQLKAWLAAREHAS